jgi:hypothetical protein
LAGLRSGKEHEQQQAHPVDEVEDVAVLLRAIEEVRDSRETSEQGGAEHDAGEDFANDFGLAKPDKESAQQLGEASQKKENEQNGSKL